MTKRVIVSSPLMKVLFHNLFYVVGFPTVETAFFVNVLGVLFLDFLLFFLCLFFVAQAGLPACLPLVGLDGWGSTLLFFSLQYFFAIFTWICVQASYLVFVRSA